MLFFFKYGIINIVEVVMKKLFFNQLYQSVKSILPITFIILAISIVSFNYDLINLIPSFLIGSGLLIIGMTLFNLGVDISMVEIGSEIGSDLTKKKTIPLILMFSFIIGFIVTIAEPDLSVLASQVPSISDDLLINFVGLGVGIFLLLAVIRLLFQLHYSLILTIFCIITFVLAFFTPSEFVPLAFDAGGVTTGPLSVPFIIALGAGLAFKRRDKKKKEDTFGIISFCSIGPVIIVLILGIIFNAKSSYVPYDIPNYGTFGELIRLFINTLPKFLWDVLEAFSPIVIFFLLYNFLFLKLEKKKLIKIFKGLIYTYLGLTFFLWGINAGFLPIGYMIGKVLSDYQLILVPIAMVIGYFIVISEPAVGVLTEQIEEITNGNIKRKILNISLSIAVSIATGLAVIHAMTGISIIWFLLPGYLIAIVLSLFVPQIFTAIAFDSGGVASGTLTATFLLPFVVGISESLGRNVLTDAFGLIAIVATTPLVVVQIVGLIYKIKTKKIAYKNALFNEEIIDY